MIPNIYRYPLDLTGQNTSNFVTGEDHAIGAAPARALAPKAGAFFGASMQIVDAVTQKPLTPNQFRFQFLHEEATVKTGQEVWGVVVVIDPTVSSNISLSYQALGGPDAAPVTTMEQEIAAIGLDNRGVAFKNIKNKPDVYPPALHMHWVGDTYDWDYVVTALEICLNAMALSESATYDSTLTYIDQQAALRNTDVSTFANALAAHIGNYNNPHQVTLAQVDAYSSNQVQALIATEASNRQSADAQVNTDIQAHATNYNNPHDDTADSIGGYSISETDANLNAIVTAINAQLASDLLDMNEHIANHSNPHKVSLTQIDGQSTAQINTTIANAIAPIQTQLNSNIASMNAHIANTSNPHQLTLAQIGALDSASINSLNTSVNAHIGNVSNPHGVTASQAGTWTSAQVNSAIQNSYTTPITSALNSQANAINSHTGNRSNPHGVTAYQIGGWLYGDWINALNNQVYALSYH